MIPLIRKLHIVGCASATVINTVDQVADEPLPSLHQNIDTVANIDHFQYPIYESPYPHRMQMLVIL